MPHYGRLSFLQSFRGCRCVCALVAPVFRSSLLCGSGSVRPCLSPPAVRASLRAATSRLYPPSSAGRGSSAPTQHAGCMHRDHNTQACAGMQGRIWVLSLCIIQPDQLPLLSKLNLHCRYPDRGLCTTNLEDTFGKMPIIISYSTEIKCLVLTSQNFQYQRYLMAFLVEN